MRIRALLLLAIAAGIHAGPIGFEEGTCSTTCVPTIKFGYESGTTYRFEYEAETVTLMAGASEEHSALHIRSTVDISVLSPCELVLKLGDTTLEESDPKDLSRRQVSQNSGEFRAALESNPLRFSFQDGRVESLCASEDEPKWVVNFKRGVLSAFQNSMENFDNDATVSETDISGNCEAIYKISDRGINSGVSLTKSKNLLGCTDRTGYFTSLQATTYRVPSEVQSLPLIKSTHECEQTISSSGVLQSSQCTESHMFRPFSNHDSGAVTTVKQGLTFKNVIRAATPRTGPVTQRSTLLFEHEPRHNGNSNDQSEVISILSDICASKDIRPETAKSFAKLVYAMRQLDVYTLKKVHRMVESGTVCSENIEMSKKFFHDAIPAAGTAASIALIRELTSNGEITGPEADVWITSLAFVQEPTAEMIKEAKEIITSDRHPSAYLAVTSLVNSFCKSTNCDSNPDVEEIIRTLTQNLGYNCKDGSQEKVLMSLKALGNAGTSRNTLTTLARCAANEDASVEIRLAAIQAYRRLPCSEDREPLMTLLMNTNEDSEIRIGAYLGVMSCPSEVILTQVKHVLENEEINQVGSFIWTHLTNLKETNDPLKQEIRAIVEDEKLTKEFNMDARKFSRNYEGAFFLESMNAGASYESNLIWSPSSFLPRSAMLNLTVDMFGKSVNLLEVGGRMEGMEKYLEKFFGPEGYFPESTVSDLIKGKIESADRALNEKMARPDPKASTYMKMFGNELRYFDLTGMEQGVSEFNILDLLIKLAQNHEIDITRSTMFLDTELTVPTAVGLPLKLAVNGTATVDIKIGGKMDIRRAATLPSSFDIDGYVKPSGAVTFSSTMGVDACMSRTGLKMVTTLHSSTELNGKVTLEESKIMNAKFNVPKDKIEILSVEKTFFILHNEVEREQKMLTDNVIDKSYCTGETIATITGMKVCGDIKFPRTNKVEAPYMPLNGPVSMHLTMEAADTHRSYEFEARVESKKERREGILAITNVARLAFNTPGSKIDREFLAEYNLDRLEKTINANFKTPWKQATVAGSITNTAELKNANIQMTVDGRWKYTAIAETAISQKGPMMIYSPNFSISAPGMEPISFTGNAKITPMDKIDVDLSVNNVFNTPVTVRGGIDKTTPNRFTTDLTIQSPIFNTQVTGFTVVKNALVSTRTEFKYDYNSGPQHQFVLNGKFKDASTNNAAKYNLNTAIQTSEYPEYNVQLEADFMLNRRQLDSSLELVYGDNPKDIYKKIVFKQNAEFDGDWRAMTLDYTMNAMWKAMGVNMNSKVAHKHDINREINTQAVITYSPGKDITVDLDLKKESLSPIDVSTDLKVTIPGREMRFFTSVNEKEAGQYTHELITQWQAGKQIRLVTEYAVNSQTHQMKSEIYRPSGAMSTISGEVVADWDDFKSKFNLNHEGQAYSTGIEYTYILKPNKKQVGGKFDLVIPQRHVIIQSDVSAIQGNYVANFLTQWDAENDESKKVNINGRLGLSNNNQNHEGQIKIIYPGRKVTFTLSQNFIEGELNHHSELSWHPRKTITFDVNGNKDLNSVSGSMKMSSPFTNEITLSGNAQKVRDEVKGHFEVNYGRVISTDVSLKIIDGWKNMESSINVNTPFSGIETLALTTNHELSKGLKKIHVELAKNADKIEVDGKLESINGKHEGIAEIMYPGRKAGLKFTLVKTATELVHHSEVSWSWGKPIILDVEGSLTPSSFSGNVKIDSPFTAKDLSLNINGQNNNDNMEGHVELDYGNKISADVASKRINGWRNMENSIIIHTPFRGLDRMTLATVHNLEGEEKNIHFEVEKNANKVELNAAGKFDDNSMEANIELKTPFTSPLALKSKATLKKSEVDGKIEVEWQNKKAELEVGGKYEDKVIEGKAELKTPYTEPLSLKGEASFDKNELTAKVELECQDKKLELEVTGKSNGISREGSIEIKTPYTEPVALHGSATVSGGEVVSHFELKWERKTAELDVNGKYQNQIIEGGIEIKNPYTEPIAIRSSTTFNSKEGNTKLEIEWEDKKIEVEATGKNVFEINSRDLEAILSLKTPFTEDILIQAIHKDDGIQFNSNVMAKLSQRQQISFELVMNHNMNGIYFNNDGKLTIATPFSKFRDIAINWNQDFQGWNNMKSRNEIQYIGQTVLLNIEHAFKMTSYSQKLNTAIIFESPFAEVRNIDAGVGYILNRSKFQGSASLTHNDKNYFTLSSESTYAEPEITAEVQFQSIIPYAEDLSLNYNLKYGSVPQTSVLEIKWAPGKVITVNNEHLQKNEGFTGTWRLTTPFKALDRLLVSYDHDKIDGEWKSKGSIEYAPNQVVAVETGFSMARGISASLDLSTPCTYFRKLTCSLLHSGYGSNINHRSAFAFEMHNVNVNYDGQLNMRGITYINGNAQLTSPFKYMRNHKLSIEHNKNEAEYVTKALYQFNRKNVNVETHFQNANGLFKFSTDAKSSFRAAKSLEFGIEHQSNGNRFSGKATIDSKIMEQPIIFSANYGKQRTEVSGDFQLNTPFYGAENVAGQLSFDAPTTEEITMNADIKLDANREIICETQFSLIDGLKLSTKIQTPFREFRKLSLNLDHTNDLRRKQIDSSGKFELILEDGSIELEENLRMNGMNLFKGDLTLKTPYRNADKFVLTVNHEMTRDMEVNEEISFEYPNNKKIQLTRVINANENDDVVATSVFRSPFSGFENIKLVSSYKTDTHQASGNMALTYAAGKTITFELMVSKKNKFSMLVETPFEKMSHLYCEGALIKSSKNLGSQFKGEMTIRGEKTTISGTTSIKSSGNKLECEANFQSNFPRFEDISVSGTIEAKETNKILKGLIITGNLNVPSNQMAFNSDLNFPSITEFDGEATFTGPVALGLNFKHRGDHKNFEQSLTFNRGQETVAYEGKFSPKTGNFKLTTPYQYVKLYELQFNIEGKPDDFRATAEVTYAPNKQIGTETTFKLDNGVHASFELESPFSKPIKVSVSHEGTYNFVHKTEGSYGQKTMALSGKFQTYPSIEGEIEVTTPFNKMRSVKAELKHSGSLRKFTNIVNINHNKKNTVNTEINFDSTITLTGNVKIDSSFGRMFSVDFDHNANFPEFTTTGIVNIGSKRIALDTAFTMNPTEGHFKLQTPMESLNDIDATFNHNGPINNFETVAKFTYNKGSPIEANVKFTNENVMTGSFELTSPYECMKSLSGEFSHKYNRRVLQCHGMIKLNEKEVRGDVDFKVSPIDGTIHLTTPIPHMEDITLTLTHQGELSAFNTMLKIDHNEWGTAVANGKFDLNPIEGSLRIETPSRYMRNAMLKFNHDGSLSRFTHSLELEHNLMGKVQYSGKLKIKPIITGEFKFETPCPYLKETSLAIKHEGSISDFNSHIEFNHDKLGKAVFDGNFKPWTGNVVFKSACPYAKDIHAEFNHVDGKTNAEMSYNGMTIKATAEIQLQPIRAEISVEIPSGRTYGVQLNHNGKLTNFQSKIILLKDQSAVVSSQLKLDTRSGVSAEFELSNPITDDIAIVYNHNGDVNQFTCSGNLKVNNKQVINGELNFKLRPIEITVDLQTPYSAMRQMKAAVSHAGRINNFRTNVDLTHNFDNKYHGDINFKLTSNKVMVDMHTPISWLNHIEITAAHSGEITNFKTNADVTVNDGEKYAAEVAFQLTQNELNIDVKTPSQIFRHVELAATHSGSSDNFRTNVELTLNDGDKYILGVACSLTPTELNLEIQTPVSWMQHLEVSASHSGSINNFRSSVSISHNNGNKYQGDVTFRLTDNELNLILQTPVSWLKHLKIAATFEGSLDNLRTSAEVTYNSGKTYKGEVAYNVSPNEFNIDIKTPVSWLKHLEVATEFTGTIEDFKSSLEVTHNNGRKYQGELAFQFTPTKISIDIKTPLSWLQHLEAEATFTGNLKNFESTVVASHNDGGRYQVDVAYTLTPTEVRLNLQTPLTWMRTLELSSTFTGSAENFRTTIEATCNNNGKYNADMSFKLAAGELNINVETPHEQMRKMQLDATHTGNRRNFRTNVELTHNDDQKYYADASFKQYPLEGRINVRTPWDEVRDTSLSFNHNGDKTTFLSAAEVIIDGVSKAKANVEFRRNPLTGSITINTPIRGAEETSITFSHSGDYSSFQNHGEIMIFNKKYTADNSFSRNPMEWQSVITTPITKYERLEFIYNQKGNLRSTYTSHAEVTYKAGKKVELDVDFKFYKRLNMEISLKTPFRNIATNVKYENNNGAIKSLASINCGRGQTMEAALDLNLGNHPNGKFEITLPIDGFEQLTANFDHQYSGSEFTSNANISYNGKEMTYTANGQYTNLANMGMKIELRTPFSNAEYFMLSGKTEGNLEKFISELDILLPREYSVKGTFTLETTRGIKADLKTNIRGMEDVVVNINHVSNGRKISTDAEITYASRKLMAFAVDLTRGSQSFDGSIRLSSAIRYLENLVAEVHHKGSLANFRSNAMFSWADGKDIKATAAYSSVNGIPQTSSLTFTTPFTNPITMEFNNNMNGNNMDASGVIGWGRDQAINIRGQGSCTGRWSDLTLNANGEITTPFRRLNHISFDTQHQHSSSMIDNAFNCQHNRKNIAESKITLNPNTGLMKINGPWPLNVNMNYNRDRNGGSLTMDSPITVDARYTKSGDRITFDVREPIKVDATVQFTRNGGVVTMSTPFEVDAAYTLDNNQASINVQKPFQVDAQGSYSRNGGTFNMMQPFKVEAGYTLNEDGAGFEMQEPLAVDAIYTYTRNSGSFNMQKPYPVDISYRLNRNGGSFNMQQPIQVDATVRYNNDGGSFSMQNPYPVDASYSLEKDGASFQMRNPYPVDASYTYSRNSASFNMQNPYPIDASYTYNGKDGSVQMKSPYQIEAGYNMDRDGVSVNMKAPYEIDAGYKMTGNSGSINMAKPYPIDASYNIGRNVGSVSVQQPYPVEARYTVGPSEGSISIEKPVSFEMSYKYSGKQGEVLMTKPLQMSASYDVKGESLKDISGSVGVNWDTNRRDSKARVEFMHKCDSTQSILKKTVSLKTILPTRTTAISGNIEMSQSRFMQTAEVMWDEARDRKVSYLIEANKNPVYSTTEYDLTARLNTPIRSMETVLFHKEANTQDSYTSTATMKWDLTRDQSKTVTLTNHYEITGPTYKSEMTVSSPLMNKDIVLRNEFTINDGDILYTCHHELQYSDDSSDNLMLTTRFADDGNHKRGNHNYTGAISLVHPRSTIDVQINSFLALTDVLAASGMKVNYMTVNRETKSAQLRAEINKIRKTINIELDTPLKKAEVRGQFTKNDGIYKYGIVATDETSQVSTDIIINREENSFDIAAHLNPANPSETITFRGNYLSPTALQVQALHSNGGEEITDSEISINMDNKNLLRTRMHWRPAVWEDMKSAGSSLISNIMNQAQNIRLIREIRSVARREAEGKLEAIKSILPSYRPLKEFLSSEAESFSADWKVVKKELNRMYWQNEFFMKDIDAAIDATVKVMYKAAAFTVKHMSKMINATAKVINFVYTKAVEFFDDYIVAAIAIYERYAPEVMRKYRQIMTLVRQYTAIVANKVHEIISEAVHTTIDILSRMAMSLKPYIEAYIRFYNHVSKWVQETIAKVQQKYNDVKATYPFNRFGAWYNKAKSVATKYGKQASNVNIMGPIYNAHISMTGKINDLTDRMAQHADRISDKYASVIYTAHRIIGSNVENYIHRPASDYVRQWLTQARDQAKMAYNYLGVEEMCKNFMEKVMDWGIEAVKTNAIYLTEQYLHLDLTKIVSYDPRNGDIDFQMWIPDELPSIQYVPFTNIKWSELLDRMTEIRSNMDVAVPDEFNPWDYYYQYKPASMNPVDWIPPFKGIAMVTGQHITTFDNTQYEFLGTCSYILARDVVDGSFTAIKDYDKNIYRVFIDGKQIDVAMTGQVSLDRVDIEIPTEFESTTIIRKGDAIIISSKRGFNMVIDTYSDLFTLEVSGWYYNKVAGLLGTYTNEHADDYLMANAERTDSLDRLTESWQVGSCHRHANIAKEHFIDEARPSGRICKFLFESRASPLKNCFKVVNPEKFLKACVNDVEETADDKRGVCKAADAYAMICKKKGVKVQVPRPCRKCQDESQASNPSSSDVIFIIEQKQCNNDMVSKIDNLAMMVDKALNGKGLSGNRFGLIGFGGKGIHDEPHSHTLGGKLMGISREMKPAAESLLGVENGENNDAVGALKFATEYPFRAGVAKSVILITCGPCSEGVTSIDEVREELEMAGIQLHVMVEHNFAVSNVDVAPKTSYLYGIDSGVAYTKADVRDRELNGDAELHKEIIKPDNKCVNLALGTNGSFFNLQKLKEGRVRYQKHFMDVFARRVAKTSESDECSVCECNDEGIKTCRPCDNSVILGRPDEEPAQFFDKNFEQDFQEYISSP